MPKRKLLEPDGARKAQKRTERKACLRGWKRRKDNRFMKKIIHEAEAKLSSDLRDRPHLSSKQSENGVADSHYEVTAKSKGDEPTDETTNEGTNQAAKKKKKVIQNRQSARKSSMRKIVVTEVLIDKYIDISERDEQNVRKMDEQTAMIAEKTETIAQQNAMIAELKDTIQKDRNTHKVERDTLIAEFENERKVSCSSRKEYEEFLIGQVEHFREKAIANEEKEKAYCPRCASVEQRPADTRALLSMTNAAYLIASHSGSRHSTTPAPANVIDTLDPSPVTVQVENIDARYSPRMDPCLPSSKEKAD